MSTSKSKGGLRFTKGQFEGGWKPMGIIYWKEAEDDAEMMIQYLEHIPKKVKDAILAKFGVAAHQWNVSE